MTITYDISTDHLFQCCDKIHSDFSSDEEDGRLVSAIKEKDVLAQIEKYAKKHEIPYETAKSRSWYDFKFNKTYYNLKLTDGGTDNIFNKIAVIYSITGKIPVKHNLNFKQFLEYVKPSKWKKARDFESEYHYLVFNKKTGNYYIIRLMSIMRYHTNPSNILQANWKYEFDNDNPDITEWSEKIKRLLNTIQASIKQDIKAKNEFAEYDFNECDLAEEMEALQITTNENTTKPRIRIIKPTTKPRIRIIKSEKLVE